MIRLDSVVLALVALCVTAVPYNAIANFSISQQCLSCICEAMSSCDISNNCYGQNCDRGPYRITYPYWLDGGGHTYNNEAPESASAYVNCVRDIHCAALSVQGYMGLYQTDCNHDGKVDCDDFAIIHKLGGFGCKGAKLGGIYGQRYERCKDRVGVS